MRACLFALLLAASCARSRAPATAPAAAAAPADAETGERDRPDPAFPERKVGWDTVPDDARAPIDRFAGGYLAFLARARTERRASAELVTRFGAAAADLDGDGEAAAAPGKRYVLRGPGEAVALVRVGGRPIEEGLRIVIAAVDAPHIRIKQNPIFSEHNLAMLDTEVYGAPSLESWLATPLVLDVYAARPGASSGPVELAIGDDADEPVLVIPDLLPHLSRTVQNKQIVDDPERMNAVAGRSSEKLLAFLGRHGLAPSDFASAEARLVPAQPPVFLGTDRAEIGGYGHEHRALAYAAAEALGAVEMPYYTSVVIVIGDRLGGYDSSASLPFVRLALRRVLARLSSEGADADTLSTQRALSRSAALVAHYLEGGLGDGVVLSPHADDADPAATRRVLRAAAHAEAGYQIVGKTAWDDPARDLSRLDLDLSDVAIPVADRALPMQRLSTYDLYQAYLLCRGWFTRGDS